jgi:hypothetical protein
MTAAATSPLLAYTGDPTAYIVRMRKLIASLQELLQNSKRKDEEKAIRSPAQVQAHEAQPVHNVAGKSQPITGRKRHSALMVASRQVRHRDGSF